MSNLREKARAVKEAGVAERGNFTPTGAPKRLYEFWVGESDSRRAKQVRLGVTKENFCHFWRVVLFWAPLMGIRRKVIETVPFAIALVAAAIAVFIWAVIMFGGVREVVLGIIVILAVLVSQGAGMFGMASLFKKDDDERKYADLPPLKYAIPMALVGFIGALVALVFLVLEKIYDKYLSDKGVYIGIGAIVLAISSAIIAGFVTEGVGSTLIVVGLIVAGLVVLAGALVGCVVLSDYISGRRALAKRKAREARYEAEERGETPVEEKKGGFFSGIADFIVFVSQVVRVNKWKICPLVEVDTKEKYV